MKKSMLSLGLLAACAAGGTHATELVPLSYKFDRETDCGSYCYHDSTGKELIDGVYGVKGWAVDLGKGNAAEWVGWVSDSPVNIDFDFGAAVVLDRIDVGTTQDYPGDVVLPSVSVYASNDGTNWLFAGSLSVPEDNANNASYLSMDPHGFLTLTALDMGPSRYVRVALIHSSDGPWTFADEIDFHAAPVPEPGTYALMLGGLGLLGAAARRRRC